MPVDQNEPSPQQAETADELAAAVDAAAAAVVADGAAPLPEDARADVPDEASQDEVEAAVADGAAPLPEDARADDPDEASQDEVEAADADGAAPLPEDARADDPDEETEEEPEEEFEDDVGGEWNDGVRARLVAQFEEWLDRILEGEPPPDGLPPELVAAARVGLEADTPPTPGADLYALFAGLTRLGGEVGLQGRAFRQVADALSPLADLPQRLERLEAAHLAAGEQLDELLTRTAGEEAGPLPPVKDVLHVLFDLYDRLGRGLRTLEAAAERMPAAPPRRSLWQRLTGGGPAAPADTAAALEPLLEGYRLTLSRLSAALHQWGIDRTGAPGEAFDPGHMAAVDVGPPTAACPEGTVLEIYRSGYTLHGETLATAQVKVARADPPRR